MPNPPYGFTYFCDDIRFEVGAKASLMGTYRGVMHVPMLPITLPRFCIIPTYLRPYEGDAPRTQSFEFHVWMPPGNPETEPSFRMALAKEAIESAAVPSESEVLAKDPHATPHMRIDFPIILQPFIIAAAGTLRVGALWNGELTRVGALRIELAAVSQFPPSV